MPIVLAWLSLSLNKIPRPWFLASLPSPVGIESVCENPCDPAFIPECQVTKWWFHLEVPLGGF